MRKLLLVLAHPDDETFSCGGTIAKYIDAGWGVDLICATRGEEGQSGPFANVTKEQLGEIRKKEVERAGMLLGISTITFLGQKDGELKNVPSGEMEEAVYKKMIEIVPDCVITFGTDGISNHPDHIKMSYVTTFAFQKYASWIASQIQDAAPKLYYAVMPESIATYLKKKKNIPVESYKRPWTGTEDKQISTIINIKKYKETKKKALLSHVSQSVDIQRFLSLKYHPLLDHEYFILRMHGTIEAFMGKNDRVASRL